MKYKKLNNNWNADPNAPEPEIYVKDGDLQVFFYLNYHIYDHIKEGQRGDLIFTDCYMYRVGSPNDHGFYLGQFRYGRDDIEWGEFYELFESDWQINFPDDKVILKESLRNDKGLRHFLFFFRDEGFECIAKNFLFEYLPNNEKNPNFPGVKVYPVDRPADEKPNSLLKTESKVLSYILGVIGLLSILINFSFYFLDLSKGFNLIPWGIILIFMAIQMRKKKIFS